MQRYLSGDTKRCDDGLFAFRGLHRGDTTGWAREAVLERSVPVLCDGVGQRQQHSLEVGRF